MNETYIEMGGRLEHVRTMLGMKQDEFARAIGSSRSALNTYLNGSRPIPVASLSVLNSKYGVDPVWLIEGDEKDGLTSRENVMFARLETLEEFLDKQLTQNNVTLDNKERWKALKHLYSATKAASLNNDDQEQALKRETETVINLMSR